MSRWMRSALGAGALLVLTTGSVAAHPLGNFTINHFSRVVIGDEQITVRYVVDMAEVPAFQERSAIDLNNDEETDAAEVAAYLDSSVPELVGGLRLVVAGSRLPLAVETADLSFPPGQGGLPTLRLVIDLRSEIDAQEGTGSFGDLNHAEQIGWREIVVQPGDGVELLDSSVADVALTDELRAYPAELANDPPDVRSATFAFRPGNGGPLDADRNLGLGGGRPDDPLASLVGGTLSPLYVALALALSAGLGALHGVSPGHGKTLVAAYLIGTRGTLGQALKLAMIVAVTHTVGVMILGALTLTATELIVPQRVIEWLSLVVGLAVVVLGVSLLAQLKPGRRLSSTHGHPADAQGHDHGHHHHHAHPHVASGLPSLSGRGLVALGLLGGLVPSGSALIVLLLGVATDRIAFGIALIVAFGFGMAFVLGAISVSVVVVRERSADGGGWFSHPVAVRAAELLPSLTAVAALITGIILTAQAIRSLT